MMIKHSELRQSFLSKQAILNKRLEAIKKDLKKAHSRDWEDQAQERENDEVLEALAAETTEELTRIHRALHNIDNDTYGICRECGEMISEKRLQALPGIDLCINCAH